MVSWFVSVFTGSRLMFAGGFVWGGSYAKWEALSSTFAERRSFIAAALSMMVAGLRPSRSGVVDIEQRGRDWGSLGNKG